MGITTLRMIGFSIKNDDPTEFLKNLQNNKPWEKVCEILDKMLKLNPKERIHFKDNNESLNKISLKKINQKKQNSFYELVLTLQIFI